MEEDPHEVGPTGAENLPAMAGSLWGLNTPSRTRTWDPLIKSQLLCQLS